MPGIITRTAYSEALIVRGMGYEADLLPGEPTGLALRLGELRVRGREKQIGGSGRSLEPPGPLS